VSRAVEDFRAAIARDSSYAAAWTALAKAYIRAEERQFAVPGIPAERLLEQAVATVDRALVLDSSSADAWLTQGIVSQRVDPTDLGPALRAVRRSIALDSTRAEAWHFLARFTTEAGDLAGGLNAWRRASRLGPTYTMGLSFLALGYYWHRQYDSARIWADSAVALEPNYLLGRTTVGQIAIEQRDFPHAIAAFEAARRVSTDVEVINSLSGRALAEARSGRRAEAIETLKQAESLGQRYSPVSLHLAAYIAQPYAALGDAAKAVAWLRRYNQRDDLHFQLHLRCDPPFDAIANDPAFQALLIHPTSGPRPAC
jgi:tetratricopeptide (TPR) repeat protein